MKRQSIALFNLSWEHAIQMTQIFTAVHISTDGCESIKTSDLGVRKQILGSRLIVSRSNQEALGNSIVLFRIIPESFILAQFS